MIIKLYIKYMHCKLFGGEVKWLLSQFYNNKVLQYKIHHKIPEPVRYFTFFTFHNRNSTIWIAYLNCILYD